MPSCELPARRTTATWTFSGRRSARSEGGVPATAGASGFGIVTTSGFTGSPMSDCRFYAVLTVTKQTPRTSDTHLNAQIKEEEDLGCERGNQFFEARVAAEWIPNCVQFQRAVIWGAGFMSVFFQSIQCTVDLTDLCVDHDQSRE